MASCAVTCTLIFLQTIFGLVGFIFLGLGLFVRFFADSIWLMAKPFVDQALAILGQSAKDGLNSDDLLDILKQIAVPLIVIGAILFLLSILGCCGTCCRIRTALLVYGIILLLILSCQIIASIVIGVDWPKYRGMAVVHTVNLLKTEYTGVSPNNTNLVTMFLNFAFMQFECCGINSYKDMLLAQNWTGRALDGTVYTVPGNPSAMTNALGQMQVPPTCCKSRYPFPQFDPYDLETCLLNPDSKSAYTEKGCFSAIDDLLAENQLYAIIAVSLIFVLQLIIIILVFCLRKCLADDKKVGPM
ncbi:tetraspanin-18B-like [Lineus longissimus]|uniref:tetraspanin-18B-like n=1 Tax=Lineus longissimus TaxID=88925 RepID=UPI002B4E08A0